MLAKFGQVEFPELKNLDIWLNLSDSRSALKLSRASWMNQLQHLDIMLDKEHVDNAAYDQRNWLKDFIYFGRFNSMKTFKISYRDGEAIKLYKLTRSLASEITKAGYNKMPLIEAFVVRVLWQQQRPNSRRPAVIASRDMRMIMAALKGRSRVSYEDLCSFYK